MSNKQICLVILACTLGAFIFVRLATRDKEESKPCTTPNYYDGKFHNGGCLSANDLNAAISDLKIQIETKDSK